MTSYLLKEKMTSKEAYMKLKKNLKDTSILEIGLNEKGEPFVRTEWYIYIAKVKQDTVKLPNIWSQQKKPYLIGGIGLVLFFMFFIGGLITDVMVIGILFSLGLVNVWKRSEIRAMKHAICEALNH
ncbi:MAG: hypothetical protein ACRDDX_07025 [Cellulosilyticaceae bacterium]